MFPRAIAHTLNDEGVKSPPNKVWGPTIIKRQLLPYFDFHNNDLYVGRLVWSRLHYAKNPSTGKRVSRLNPEEKWVIEEARELRIVSDELWERGKNKQKSLDKKGAFYDNARPHYFWTGKVKGGQCGSSYIKISRDHLGCAASRAKGKTFCAKRKTFHVKRLEEQLLNSLQHHLSQHENFAEFIGVFSTEWNRLQGETRGQRTLLKQKIAEAERQLDKAIDAIMDGTPASRFKERMEMLELEKAAFERKLTAMGEESPVLLYTGMTDIYKEKVGKLADALQADREDLAAFNTVRALLDNVVLHPTSKGFDIDVLGDLATILHLCAAGNKPLDTKTKLTELAFEGSGALAEQVKMVAGVGFTTAGLRLLVLTLLAVLVGPNGSFIHRHLATSKKSPPHEVVGIF